MIRVLLNRLLRDARGAIAVEFALTAPVFILMLIGLADYGLAARQRSTLDAAARSGLQALLNNPGNMVQAKTVAETIAADATVDAGMACSCIDGSTVDCTAGTCANGAPRRVVIVSATESHALLFPWPGFENPMSLSAVAQGRIR
jgi:Flp pilus assembly protein TadG